MGRRGGRWGSVLVIFSGEGGARERGEGRGLRARARDRGEGDERIRRRFGRCVCAMGIETKVLPGGASEGNEEEMGSSDALPCG